MSSHADRPHARLGGSKAKRWINCPGSVKLSEQFPDDGPSKYAAEGTAAHELAEACLRSNRDTDSYIGLEFNGFEVTKDMAEAVQVFVDHVRSAAVDGEMLLEVQFDLEPLKPPEPMYGTADGVVWTEVDGHWFLQVIDYKHGRGVVVPAVDNDQLKMYALGAVVAARRQPTAVTVTIVQPRAGAEPIRSETFAYDELKTWWGRAKAAAELAQTEGAPLKAGDWCRFCPAHAQCPAQAKHALVLAQEAFSPIEDEPEAMEFPDPGLLTAEQIGRILQALPVLEDWAKALRAHASQELEAGNEVPGFKLVSKRAVRRWKDEDAAMATLRQMGLSDEAITVKKPVSPAQAEKALKAHYPRGAAPKVDDLVTKNSSGTKMVSENDPRPAVLSVKDVFTALTPPEEE